MHKQRIEENENSKEQNIQTIVQQQKPDKTDSLSVECKLELV